MEISKFIKEETYQDKIEKELKVLEKQFVDNEQLITTINTQLTGALARRQQLVGAISITRSLLGLDPNTGEGKVLTVDELKVPESDNTVEKGATS